MSHMCLFIHAVVWIDVLYLCLYRTIGYTYIRVDLRGHSLCDIQFEFLISSSSIFEHVHFKYDVVHFICK